MNNRRLQKKNVISTYHFATEEEIFWQKLARNEKKLLNGKNMIDV